MLSQASLKFAIVLLVLGNLIAVGSDAAIKSLGADVPVFQFLLLRQLIALLLLLPLLYFVAPAQRLPRSWSIHWLRGIVLALDCIAMVYALIHLPLATASALFYTAPLMVLPIAVLWAGERITPLRLAAALLGVIGVIIMLRPEQMGWPALAGLGCALGLAISMVSNKKLPKGEPLSVTLLWTTALSIPLLAVMAIPEWQAVDWPMLKIALVSATTIMIYNALAVLAYRCADASALSPVEYSGLVLAAIVGVLVFDEVPDIFTLLGMCIIVSPLWLLSKDHRREQKRKAATVHKAGRELSDT